MLKCHDQFRQQLGSRIEGERDSPAAFSGCIADLLLDIFQFLENPVCMLQKNLAVRIYYRNLLGGLYRENPVKSRNYEAVKSSKKWENVGNSYIIPALLLYRYSYI